MDTWKVHCTGIDLTWRSHCNGDSVGLAIPVDASSHLHCNFPLARSCEEGDSSSDDVAVPPSTSSAASRTSLSIIVYNTYESTYSLLY